ncbi:MAG: HD domain-containing phosphohydrolase [Armatimonadota bacterium]
MRHQSVDPRLAVGAGDYAPDRRRKQLLWLALCVIAALGLALVLLVAYGQDAMSSDRTELLLLIGLLAFLTCTVAYFADKEREQRAENRALIGQLHDTAQALDARVARLNQLCETSAHLAGVLDIGRISDLIVETLAAQVRADAASLVLLDSSKGECLLTRSSGPLAHSDEDRNDPVAIVRAAAQEGPSIRSLDSAPEIAHQLRAWDKIRATISAPMKISRMVTGALSAIRQDTFDGEDLSLLTTLANMASKAIESAELHQQLRKSYLKTLHVLARTLAARDSYSAAHGEAVTLVAVRMGEHLDVGEEAVEALRTYCPLHDLGKIGIPDSILLKEGPLTVEELGMCRQHTVIGEEIIQPLSPGTEALSLVRSHHERWDGTGYPDGIKGEQIPLLARIVAVADAFHAIISHRSYRGGSAAYQALREVKAKAGTQFDPLVVKALVGLWDNGELAKLVMRLGQVADQSDRLDLSASLSGPRLPEPAANAGTNSWRIV